MPTIAEQWIEEGLKRGLEQGREEGRREEALKLLRRFLARRLGTALDRFDEQLKGLDLAALDQLSEVAFEIEHLANFEVALARLQPPVSDSSLTNP